MTSPRAFLVGFIAAAAAVASAAAAPAQAAAPRVLLRLEAREETFGILCCPQHAIAYAGVELLTDGRLRAAIFGPPGTLDLAGPPTVSIHTGQLDGSRLRRVGQLLAEARIGQAEDCDAHLALVFFASASTQLQRLTWHGRGTRTQAFGLTEGPDCDPAIAELVGILADAFRQLREAPP